MPCESPVPRNCRGSDCLSVAAAHSCRKACSQKPNKSGCRITPGTGFTILSRPPINYRPSPHCGIESRWERQLERSCVALWLARVGSERGLSAAELLPTVAVVLAGRHQGRLSRTREHRRQLRSRGAFAELRDEAAERGVAEDLCEALDESGLHAVQCLPARSFRLPILRRPRRPDLRSFAAAVARRP